MSDADPADMPEWLDNHPAAEPLDDGWYFETAPRLHRHGAYAELPAEFRRTLDAVWADDPDAAMDLLSTTGGHLCIQLFTQHANAAPDDRWRDEALHLLASETDAACAIDFAHIVSRDCPERIDEALDLLRDRAVLDPPAEQWVGMPPVCWPHGVSPEYPPSITCTLEFASLASDHRPERSDEALELLLQHAEAGSSANRPEGSALRRPPGGRAFAIPPAVECRRQFARIALDHRPERSDEALGLLDELSPQHAYDLFGSIIIEHRPDQVARVVQRQASSKFAMAFAEAHPTRIDQLLDLMANERGLGNVTAFADVAAEHRHNRLDEAIALLADAGLHEELAIMVDDHRPERLDWALYLLLHGGDSCQSRATFADIVARRRPERIGEAFRALAEHAPAGIDGAQIPVDPPDQRVCSHCAHRHATLAVGGVTYSSYSDRWQDIAPQYWGGIPPAEPDAVPYPWRIDESLDLLKRTGDPYAVFAFDSVASVHRPSRQTEAANFIDAALDAYAAHGDWDRFRSIAGAFQSDRLDEIPPSRS